LIADRPAIIETAPKGAVFFFRAPPRSAARAGAIEDRDGSAEQLRQRVHHDQKKSEDSADSEQGLGD
jgi:hypothetical protein